jgi:hypothetical protein
MGKDVDSTALLLFVEAWLTVTYVDMVIRLRSFRHWRHWLKSEAGTLVPGASARLFPCVRAVDRAARYHPLPINCLRRSLALQRMLQRRKLPSHLHIGVRKGKNGLEAHAWLSSGGRILNDTPDVVERYAELTGQDGVEFLTGRWGGRIESGEP